MTSRPCVKTTSGKRKGSFNRHFQLDRSPSCNREAGSSWACIETHDWRKCSMVRHGCSRAMERCKRWLWKTKIKSTWKGNLLFTNYPGGMAKSKIACTGMQEDRTYSSFRWSGNHCMCPFSSRFNWTLRWAYRVYFKGSQCWKKLTFFLLKISFRQLRWGSTPTTGSPPEGLRPRKHKNRLHRLHRIYSKGIIYVTGYYVYTPKWVSLSSLRSVSGRAGRSRFPRWVFLEIRMQITYSGIEPFKWQ